eukprot:m51a1_g498 hypothetical protein (267) ;mRNA; r:263066-264173
MSSGDSAPRRAKRLLQALQNLRERQATLESQLSSVRADIASIQGSLGSVSDQIVAEWWDVGLEDDVAQVVSRIGEAFEQYKASFEEPDDYECPDCDERWHTGTCPHWRDDEAYGSTAPVEHAVARAAEWIEAQVPSVSVASVCAVVKIGDALSEERADVAGLARRDPEEEEDVAVQVRDFADSVYARVVDAMITLLEAARNAAVDTSALESKSAVWGAGFEALCAAVSSGLAPEAVSEAEEPQRKKRRLDDEGLQAQQEDTEAAAK